MKNFKQHQAIQILELTPAVLHTLLGGLDNGWINCKEGENTWISFDVVGHLLHGEQTDYIECLTIILSENTDKKF
ncbi:MAG: hypothetical protein IPO27_13220 [Bacteroidetes bacterium]|nr:hypothetical protein [Bacteroidota bacterium]